MKSKQVFVVIGTRPEAIKMIPVIQALRDLNISALTVVTGQHREMLRQAFAAFKEKPDIDLDLMTINQGLSAVTCSVLERMTALLAEMQPSIVLVHGDTTTAMASAMASFYARIPIGHVEAGLRSFSLDRPFPEEMNRVVIDSFADYLFAPTETACENLKAEYAARNSKIYNTGNTGIDAVLFMAKQIDQDPSCLSRLDAEFNIHKDQRKLILVTGHRRESFGGGFEQICDGLSRIASRGDARIIYPVHLNPNVMNVVRARLGECSNIDLIEPVDYTSMVYLMSRAHILLTDSGGIQEEGPALGKPVFVMRDVTERPEALATGVVSLVGASADLIAASVGKLLDSDEEYRRRARPVFPYGDGTAARQIAEIIAKDLEL